MTATATMTTPTKTDAFEALQARYPKVRKPIVMALHILTQDPNVSLDDAKARAEVHGIRITAASVSAAQRLLSRQDGDDAPKPAARTQAKAAAPAATVARTPRTRPTKEVNAEAMITSIVDKIRSEASADAERIRVAVRKAIAVLQAVVA